MFDIAPTELLLVAFIAIVVIGPKDLPKAMRIVGYWVGRARGVARQFRSGFDAMVREAELKELEARWEEENKRIMAEHPTDSGRKAILSDDAELPPTAAEAQPDEHPAEPAAAPASADLSAPAPVEPMPVESADVQEEKAPKKAGRKAAPKVPVPVDDRPATVEKPKVRPAKSPAKSNPDRDKAAS